MSDDKQIAEFVKELRRCKNEEVYQKAADIIERQQNKCWACEKYYEDTIKTQQAELEILKDRIKCKDDAIAALKVASELNKEAGNGD